MRSKKNIKSLLIVSDRYYPKRDGLVRFLSEVIPKIKNKFKITLLVPELDHHRNNVKGDIKGVKIIFIPRSWKKISDLWLAKPKFRLIKKLVAENDIVWIQSFGILGIIASHYAYLLKKKCCVYTHILEWELCDRLANRDILLKKIAMIIVKKLAHYYYNRLDLLMVPSEGIGSKIKRLGIFTKQVVAPLSIDLNKFKANSRKEVKAIRRKLKIGKETIIGYTGRIAREKDLLTLLAAFKILKKRFKLKLLIVGDGPIEEKRLLAKEGVIITGFVDNVEDYLNIMDIFVLPSLTETTSLSTIEAMACKLPVVTTGVGYIKQYITDGFNGVIFKKGNVSELATKLEKLILNKKLRAYLGNNANLIIRKNISSLDYTCKNIVSVLNSM